MLTEQPQRAEVLATRVLREYGALALLISILVLIPCFWHRHIEAGDLGSHVYNAWLAELIERGKAPGLYFIFLWKNVLFDFLLLGLAKLFGFAAAEKIAVSLSVLVFFWGVFAFIAVVTRKLPWFVTPCIAMLAYGYAFEMGFMNYYLSIGLACVGLALLWPGERNGIIAVVVISPVILLARCCWLWWPMCF